MGLVSFFCQACARVTGETANDPPARDFRSRAEARPRRLDPFVVLEVGPSLDPLLAEGLPSLGLIPATAASLAPAIRADEAANGAFLRAFERAVGADEFNVPEIRRSAARPYVNPYSRSDANRKAARAAATVSSMQVSCVNDQEDFELDCDPAEWIDYQHERLIAMAREEVQNATSSSLPGPVEEEVIDRLVDSYDVDGVDFDDEGNPCGGYEFFRADPRRVIQEARRSYVREIVARACRPVLTPKG